MYDLCEMEKGDWINVFHYFVELMKYNINQSSLFPLASHFSFSYIFFIYFLLLLK
jgi:hypothetical protein